MNNTRADIIRNSFKATLGLMLFGLGVHLVIRANMGAAPWDVFHIGLSNTLGILYGTASIVVSLTLIVIDLLIGEKIGIGTVLDAIVVGKTVDLLNWINIVPVSQSLWLSIAMMAVGLFIQGYSQYLYMQSGLCCGPRDSLQIGLGRRMPKIAIGAVNIIILATVLIIGLLLGGPFGISTLLAPFAIGVIQQLSFNMMKFDPKKVAHQDIITSLKILIKNENVKCTETQPFSKP